VLRHGHLPCVDEPDDVPDVLVLDVLDDDDRVRVRVLHQNVLEPRGAGGKDGLGGGDYLEAHRTRLMLHFLHSKSYHFRIWDKAVSRSIFSF
jgi:hypothetical protein